MPGVRWIWTGASLIAVAAVAAGCVVSPMPEPPLLRLEPGRILANGVGGPDVPTIRGEPGAAEPSGAVVRAFDLDRDEGPAEGVVAEDGSFGLDLEVTEGDEVRLQIVATTGRSEPLDVVMGPPMTTPALAPRPLSWCFLLEPEAELDLDGAAGVRATSRCEEDLVLEAPELRRPVEGVAVGEGQSWPLTLRTGESVDVRVTAEASAAVEEILFITASAPLRDRRPVTLVPP